MNLSGVIEILVKLGYNQNQFETDIEFGYIRNFSVSEDERNMIRSKLGEEWVITVLGIDKKNGGLYNKEVIAIKRVNDKKV